MNRFARITFVCAAASAATFFALSNQYVTTVEASKSDQTTIQISGYDPVSYFNSSGPLPGSDKLHASHNGQRYLFSSAENLELFKQNPGKYTPQFGGNCALGMSFGRQSKVDPEVYEIVDGKLYLLLNPGTKRMWDKKQDRHIVRANTHWQKTGKDKVR